MVSNGEHRAAIDRYLKLKAEEEARAIARMAELYQYHYLNMYDHIAKTGYHLSGRPATEWEKRIAPYVVAIPVIQYLAAAFAGRQIAKYGYSVGGYTTPPKTTSGGSRTNTTPKPVQGPKQPSENLTRVGRWMSPDEYNKMVSTGKVQMSPHGNRTYVVSPADITAFPSAKPGSVYVEFDVDSRYILPGGGSDWGFIPGPGSPNSVNYQIQKRGLPPIESMPDAYNIKKVGGN